MASQLLAAAFSFNPVASLVGAAVASALWTRARSRSGVAGAALVLLAAWAIADGVLLVAMLDRAASQGGGDKPLLVAGGLAAFAIGYALPTWTGVFVGRRVVKGTGWKSAAMVALTAAGALSAIAARLG
jgi:hypothetical protein